MVDRLDLPALSTFLRNNAPKNAVSNSTEQHQKTPQQHLAATRWLELLAAVLGCAPAWLLETGRVTRDDLAERGSIAATAHLIRSYGWQTPPVPAPAASQAPPPHTSAATLPDAWRAARDAYLGHLMTCPTCIAHRLRHPIHCPAGARLRNAYDLAPTA